MKYKLMPENKQMKITKDEIKPVAPLGNIVSATINAIAKPDNPAKANKYGICFLVSILPSLFAKVSFLIKDVLEKCRTNNGTQIIVAHINIVPRLYSACCSFETLIVTAIPKLIPNQNTKFHNLSLVSHLDWTVGRLFTATSGFVKSCITCSYIWFKPYTAIIPKIDVIAKKFLAILAVNSVILLNNTVYATDIETTGYKDYILNIIKLEEAKYSIPSGLLLALVKTESNLNPLALNINGKSSFFNDKDKAIEAINEAIASGVVSIDIGLAQINYKWHGRNFASLESMLSPELNIAYAARLLSKLKITHVDWHKALRHYHSANSVHNQKYSRKVVMCWLGVIHH